MKQKPSTWLNKPLRVLDFVYNARLDDYPMSDVVKVCRRMHANVIHFHCQYNMGPGFDEHGMYFRSRLAKKANRDVLGEFLPLARKAGIRTVVYMNLHWYTKVFADQHPDWWVVQHDGKRMENLYGDEDTSFCINTPWRDWSFKLLEDVCQYPIDGVFFDGPITFLSRNACYCASCKRLYAERFGRDMPAPDRGNRQDYASLCEFSADSLVRYYHDAMALIRAARPGVVGYGNYANVAEPDYAAGRANRRLVAETDALLAEGGFMYGRVSGDVLKTGASSRLYETQAAGKPAINAVSMAFGAWRWVSLSPAETRVLLSEASVGANPYYAIFVQGIETTGVAAAAEVYGFLAKNAKYYTNTVSGARVALLQSGQTLNNYAGVDIPSADIGGQKARRSGAVGNYSRAFYGFLEMLVRWRIPFDIIDEDVLTAGPLDRYAAIVLPNAACLSDGQCNAIAAFVRDGGTLVADFESSHYDEHGARRKDFGLAEVFGVKSRNELSGCRRWDYVFVEDASSPSLQWMDTGYFPAPRHNLRVEINGARTLAVFSEPLDSNLIAVADKSSEAFLVENTHGKGKCWYMPASFGEFFAETRPDVYPRMLAEMIGTEGMPLRISGAPNMMDVHVRRQPRRKRTMIHLVNLELGPIGEVVPAHGITCEVRVDHPVQSVTALKAEKALKFRQKAGRVTFLLPEVREYEVVAIEG